MSKARRRKAEKIRALLESEGETIHANASHFNQQRYAVSEDFDDLEALRGEAREIKEAAIANLDSLIEEVTASVEANGGQVHVAEDARDANAILEEIMGRYEAETVVKSKSMTTEEIEVNEHLEAQDIDVYETDLGEFVIQVAEETPSHLVGPALHKSTEEIATLFNGVFDPPEPLTTAEELTRFARDKVGQYIESADVGMTGANFVMAESGTIALVTNEGNARKTAVTPPVHVAVAGIEKLIPSVGELGPFVELIAKAATGQPIAQYVSLLTPPVDTPTMDFDNPHDVNFGGETPAGESGAGDRDFHLVLLDNGRQAMRADPELRETLYCIRCGACANSCANFQHVGGHAFGGETYTGGIATGWEAGIYGEEVAGEFNDLCTGCSRCVNACPVKIDIPWINNVVRDRVNRGADPGVFDHLVDGLSPDVEEPGLSLAKRFFGNFETVAKLGSSTAPVSNWLANAWPVRRAMDRWIGIDARRELPRFQRGTLREWFVERGSQVAEASREVVLYPDVYTNYIEVERGKAAVRVLEALGIEVHMPPVAESGRAPLSQGMVATATDRAQRVASVLDEHLDAGRDVVVIEPSDISMFQREYEKLLEADEFERLAANSYEIMEYVFGLLANGSDPAVLPRGDGRDLAYHSHCQQRTLGLETYTEAVLTDLGYDVTTSSVECCGMAGSFGYKSEYYELSMDVGETLAAEFADAGELVASGTSCLDQLEALFGRSATHPVELLDPEET